MIWADWTACTACTGGPADGARHFLAWFLESYPQGKSQGIYNCRFVAGTGSRSVHSCGRAIDCWLPFVNGGANPAGHEIVRRLGEHGKRLGIQAIIFDRTIWSARSPNGRPYTGVHPHTDHLHVELTPDAASRLTLTTLRTVIGTETGDDEMGLKMGDRSNAVRALQTHLDDWNPLLSVQKDGVYGANTKAAVAQYQTAAGLGPTGEADATTLIHLYTNPLRNQPAWKRMLTRLGVS